jgi:hypothetical protein
LSFDPGSKDLDTLSHLPKLRFWQRICAKVVQNARGFIKEKLYVWDGP